MRPIQVIRSRLSMTLEEVGAAIGRTRQNVSLYERGQCIPPEVAIKLVDLAVSRGLQITLDHVYGRADVPRYLRG